ncbi:MAG TPA: hypothetical protein VFN62_00405 [Acidobacteriaceae bacterium]|nr:hypothetical protein [Acidobacteriaceae bacterium]
MVDWNDGPADDRELIRSSDEFERQLRTSLRLRPAPEGFAERLMQRRHLVAAGRQNFSGGRLPSRRDLLRSTGLQTWLRWVAAACLLLTTAGGGLRYEHERREAGERARRQVLLALRITGTALQDVRNKIEDSPAEYRPEP